MCLRISLLYRPACIWTSAASCTASPCSSRALWAPRDTHKWCCRDSLRTTVQYTCTYIYRHTYMCTHVRIYLHSHLHIHAHIYSPFIYFFLIHLYTPNSLNYPLISALFSAYLRRHSRPSREGHTPVHAQELS